MPGNRLNTRIPSGQLILTYLVFLMFFVSILNIPGDASSRGLESYQNNSSEVSALKDSSDPDYRNLPQLIDIIQPGTYWPYFNNLENMLAVKGIYNGIDGGFIFGMDDTGSIFADDWLLDSGLGLSTKYQDLMGKILDFGPDQVVAVSLAQDSALGLEWYIYLTREGGLWIMDATGDYKIDEITNFEVGNDFRLESKVGEEVNSGKLRHVLRIVVISDTKFYVYSYDIQVALGKINPDEWGRYDNKWSKAKLSTQSGYLTDEFLEQMLVENGLMLREFNITAQTEEDGSFRLQRGYYDGTSIPIYYHPEDIIGIFLENSDGTPIYFRNTTIINQTTGEYQEIETNSLLSQDVKTVSIEPNLIDYGIFNASIDEGYTPIESLYALGSNMSKIVDISFGAYYESHYDLLDFAENEELIASGEKTIFDITEADIDLNCFWNWTHIYASGLDASTISKSNTLGLDKKHYVKGTLYGIEPGPKWIQEQVDYWQYEPGEDLSSLNLALTDQIHENPLDSIKWIDISYYDLFFNRDSPYWDQFNTHYLWPGVGWTEKTRQRYLLSKLDEFFGNYVAPEKGTGGPGEEEWFSIIELYQFVEDQIYQFPDLFKSRYLVNTKTNEVIREADYNIKGYLIDENVPIYITDTIYLESSVLGVANEIEKKWSFFGIDSSLPMCYLRYWDDRDPHTDVNSFHFTRILTEIPYRVCWVTGELLDPWTKCELNVTDSGPQYKWYVDNDAYGPNQNPLAPYVAKFDGIYDKGGYYLLNLTCEYELGNYIERNIYLDSSLRLVEDEGPSGQKYYRLLPDCLEPVYDTEYYYDYDPLLGSWTQKERNVGPIKGFRFILNFTQMNVEKSQLILPDGWSEYTYSPDRVTILTPYLDGSIKIRYIPEMKDENYEYSYAYDEETSTFFINTPISGDYQLRIIFNDIGDEFFFNSTYSLPPIDYVYQEGLGNSYYYDFPGSLNDYEDYTQEVGTGPYYEFSQVQIMHDIEAVGNTDLEFWHQLGDGYSPGVFPPEYGTKMTWDSMNSIYRNNLTLSPFLWYVDGTLGFTKGDPDDSQFGAAAYGNIDVFWTASGWNQWFKLEKIIDVAVLDCSRVEMVRGSGNTDQIPYPYNLCTKLTLVNEFSNAKGYSYKDYTLKDGVIDWDDGQGPDLGDHYFIWPNMDKFTVVLAKGDYAYRNGPTLEDELILFFLTKDKYGSTNTQKFQNYAPLREFLGGEVLSENQILSLTAEGDNMVLLTNTSSSITAWNWNLTRLAAFDINMQRQGNIVPLEDLVYDYCVSFEIESPAEQVKIEEPHQCAYSMWDIISPYIYIKYQNGTIVCYYIYSDGLPNLYQEPAYFLDQPDNDNGIVDSSILKFFGLVDVIQELHIDLIEESISPTEGGYDENRSEYDPPLFSDGTTLYQNEYWFQEYNTKLFYGSNPVPQSLTYVYPDLEYSATKLNSYDGNVWEYPSIEAMDKPKYNQIFGTYTDESVHPDTPVKRIIESVTTSFGTTGPLPYLTTDEGYVLEFDESVGLNDVTTRNDTYIELKISFESGYVGGLEDSIKGFRVIFYAQTYDGIEITDNTVPWDPILEDGSDYRMNGPVPIFRYKTGNSWIDIDPQCSTPATFFSQSPEGVLNFSSYFHEYRPYIPGDALEQNSITIRIYPRWYTTDIDKDPVMTNLKVHWLDSEYNHPDINATIDYDPAIPPSDFNGEHLYNSSLEFFSGDSRIKSANVRSTLADYQTDLNGDGILKGWENFASNKFLVTDPIDYFHVIQDDFRDLNRFLYVKDSNWAGDFTSGNLLMHPKMDSGLGKPDIMNIAETNRQIEELIEESDLPPEFLDFVMNELSSNAGWQKNAYVDQHLEENFKDIFNYRYNEVPIDHEYAGNINKNMFDNIVLRFWLIVWIELTEYRGGLLSPLTRRFVDYFEENNLEGDLYNPNSLDHKTTTFYFNFRKEDIEEMRDGLVKFTVRIPFKSNFDSLWDEYDSKKYMQFALGEEFYDWDLLGWIRNPTVKITTGNGDSFPISDYNILYNNLTYDPLVPNGYDHTVAKIIMPHESNLGGKFAFNEQVDLAIAFPKLYNNHVFEPGASWDLVSDPYQLRKWSSGQEEIRMAIMDLMKVRKSQENPNFVVPGVSPDVWDFSLAKTSGGKDYLYLEPKPDSEGYYTEWEDTMPLDTWSSSTWSQIESYLKLVKHKVTGASWYDTYLANAIPQGEWYRIGFEVDHGLARIQRKYFTWNGHWRYYNPWDLMDWLIRLGFANDEKGKGDFFAYKYGDEVTMDFAISALDVIYSNKFGWRSNNDPDFIVNPLYKASKYQTLKEREVPFLMALSIAGKQDTLLSDEVYSQLRIFGFTEGQQVFLKDILNDQKLSVKIEVPNVLDVKKINITIGARFDALWPTPTPTRYSKLSIQRPNYVQDAYKSDWIFGAGKLTTSNAYGGNTQPLRYWIDNPKTDSSESGVGPPTICEIVTEGQSFQTTIEIWTYEERFHNRITIDEEGTGIFYLNLHGGFNVTNVLLDPEADDPWRLDNIANEMFFSQTYRYGFGFAWDYLDVKVAYRPNVLATFREWGENDEFAVIRRYPGSLDLYSTGCGKLLDLAAQGWSLNGNYNLTYNQYLVTNNYSSGILWLIENGKPYYSVVTTNNHEYQITGDPGGTNGWFDYCADLLPNIDKSNYRISAIDNYLYVSDDNEKIVDIIRLNPSDPTIWTSNEGLIGQIPYPAGFTKIKGIDWNEGYLFILDVSGKIAVYDLGWSQIRFRGDPGAGITVPNGSDQPKYEGWEYWEFVNPEVTSFKIDYHDYVYGYGWHVNTSVEDDMVLILNDGKKMIISHPGPNPDPKVWDWNFHFNWSVVGIHNNLKDLEPGIINITYIDDDTEAPRLVRTIVDPEKPRIGDNVWVRFKISDKSGISRSFITYNIGGKDIILDVLYNSETRCFEVLIPGTHITMNGLFTYSLFIADNDFDGAFAPDRSSLWTSGGFEVLRGEGQQLVKIKSIPQTKLAIKTPYSQKIFVNVPIRIEYPPGIVIIEEIDISDGETTVYYTGQNLETALAQDEISFEFPLVGKVEPKFQGFHILVTYTVDGAEFFDAYTIYYYLSDPEQERATIINNCAAIVIIATASIASSIIIRKIKASRRWNDLIKKYWERLYQRDSNIRKSRTLGVPSVKEITVDPDILESDYSLKMKHLDKYGIFFRQGEMSKDE